MVNLTFLVDNRSSLSSVGQILPVSDPPLYITIPSRQSIGFQTSSRLGMGWYAKIHWWEEANNIFMISNFFFTVSCLNFSGTMNLFQSYLQSAAAYSCEIPHDLENNHACKWNSDNFPGMLTYVLFLENCQKTICMHGYSSIHVDRSLRVSNLGDKSVPYF